jgi:creatinine amidohydrolase
MVTDYKWNIGNLTYPDIQKYLQLKDIIMVPFASLEQHSYHCPLLTDTIGVREIVPRAAAEAEVLYTPESWFGYSPHHMGPPGQGLGTITVRAQTFVSLYYDVARSLIHHGFNKIIFVNGHASNMKIIDPLLRRLRYETGALVGVCRPYAENYLGLLADILEGPREETPGWHAGELETSQVMAHDENLVHMERAPKYSRTTTPAFLPASFGKSDGTPEVAFEGHSFYFVFPMEHREFSETGLIGNPFRAKKEKGEEAFRRFGSYLARALKELEKVEVKVKNREWTDRA